MKLDVGCDANPKGDVNIDIYDKNQCVNNWNPKKVANFVLASADSLPFKDEAFESLVCNHTIEHLSDPLKALCEFKRICNGTVVIRTPSQYNADRAPSHLFTWNQFTFSNLLKKVFPNVSVKYARLYLPLKYSDRKLTYALINIMARFGFCRELIAVCQSHLTDKVEVDY